MNWKYLVIAVFSGFVILIGSLVFASYKNGQDLVYENYYEKEIHFQEQIDKQQNLKESSLKPELLNQSEVLILQFGGNSNKQIKGNIFFYRPSDKTQDKTFNIQLNEKNEQVFDNKQFKEGLYKVKVDWEEEGQHYYIEKAIYITHAN